MFSIGFIVENERASVLEWPRSSTVRVSSRRSRIDAAALGCLAWSARARFSSLLLRLLHAPALVGPPHRSLHGLSLGLRQARPAVSQRVHLAPPNGRALADGVAERGPQSTAAVDDEEHRAIGRHAPGDGLWYPLHGPAFFRFPLVVGKLGSMATWNATKKTESPWR